MSWILKYTSLGGGAGEVGRSCKYFEVRNGDNWIIDAGIKLVGDRIYIPRFLEKGLLKRGVKALFISHEHLDHIGAGPVIVKHFPKAQIYCAKPAKYAGQLLLKDTIKIAEQKGEKPLFSRFGMEKFLERIITVPKPGWFQVPGTKIRSNFWPAGTHLPGAASIFIDTPEIEIIDSGDIYFEETALLSGEYRLPDFPKRKPRVVVVEATYGDNEYPSRAAEVSRLVQLVKETMAYGGNVLVCAFALGGCQNFALELDKAGIECYVDGMARQAFEIFHDYKWCWLDKNFELADTNIKRVGNKFHRFQIAHSKKPVCVVSPSGVDEGGPARYYTKKWGSHSKNSIIFPQHIFENSLAEQLVSAKQGDEISYYDDFSGRLKSFELQARVVKLDIHHHARGKETAKWIGDLQADYIIMTHGSEDNCRGLEKKILALPNPPKVFWGRNLEEIVI